MLARCLLRCRRPLPRPFQHARTIKRDIWANPRTGSTDPALRRFPISIPATLVLQRNLTWIPGYFTPPAVFAGLVVALWTCKCVLMVAFQSKIIYTPSIPPFSHQEKLESYEKYCLPVTWEKRTISASDGTKLALAIGRYPLSISNAADIVPPLVITYFQGNASSTPPRIPDLSAVLRSLGARTSNREVYIVALSYRGYWTSEGKPFQEGIELDAAACLEYVATTFKDASIVVWGQSIGAGIATVACARYLEADERRSIRGLVLETPFTSVSDMLRALYPERWLPYRYLSLFLRNNWESRDALRQIFRGRWPSTPPDLSQASREHDAHRPAPRLLLLQAAKDDLVPASHARELAAIAQSHGADVENISIPDATHIDVAKKEAAQDLMVDFVLKCAKDPAPVEVPEFLAGSKKSSPRDYVQ